MIPFDPNKLTIKLMQVKMVSGALGGTLTVLDEKRSKAQGKEVFTKLKVSHNLTRHWAKKYRVTKYLKPVLTAVVTYENHIVCLERHPLGNLGREKVEGLFGEVEWQPAAKVNFDKLVRPLTTGLNWYIDGSYVYHVAQKDITSAERLSADGKFRQVRVQAVKLANLADTPDVEERVCLAFFPSKGDMMLTPPIWKTLTNIGQRQLSARHRSNEDIEDDSTVTYIDGEIDRTQFDAIDERLCVNLGFVLKAGRELSEVFGYDSIEPLGLDDMMIQLRTVNLPTIANEVKQTFDTGMRFTIAIAWLIGLVKKTDTLDAYIVLRSLLKYLTSKGVYRKGAFLDTAIFKGGATLADVPLMTMEEAKKKLASISLTDFLTASRLAREINNGEGGPDAFGL